MDEQMINKLLMSAAAILAALFGLAAVVVLVMSTTEGFWLIFQALLLAAGSVGSTWAAVFFAHRTVGSKPIFDNAVEREVLTPRQRRDLRRKRGEVVMEKALIEIEDERQNIVHKQIESANDPEKPPHETRFSPKEIHLELDRKKQPSRDGREPYDQPWKDY